MPDSDASFSRVVAGLSVLSAVVVVYEAWCGYTTELARQKYNRYARSWEAELAHLEEEKGLDVRQYYERAVPVGIAEGEEAFKPRPVPSEVASDAYIESQEKLADAYDDEAALYEALPEENDAEEATQDASVERDSDWAELTEAEAAKILAEMDDPNWGWKELTQEEAEAMGFPVNNRIVLDEDEEDEEEEEEADEDEALLAAKMKEQHEAFESFLGAKEGNAPPERPSWTTPGEEAWADGEEGPARLVDAPATHAVLDPQTKSPHAYTKQGDSSHLQADATAGGSNLADVVAGTGVALGCLAFAAMAALLYAPRKLQQSSSSQPERNSPAPVSSSREESVELGGVKSSWAAQAVDQAVDAAQKTNP